MKYLITTIALLLLAITVSAQTEKYEPAHEGWLVNLEDAYQESQESGKPIMAFFTGSDWCPPCRRFSAAVISKPGFNEWAKDHVVLLELDNPRRKKVPNEIREQNQNLRQAFNVTGVPTVWVFNLDMNNDSGQFEIDALGKTGYTPSLEEFTNSIEKMIQ